MPIFLRFFLLFTLTLVLACSNEPTDNDKANQTLDEDTGVDALAPDADAAAGDTTPEEEIECESPADCDDEIPDHAQAICVANHCSWACDHCESFNNCHALDELHPNDQCRICKESGWQPVEDCS